MAMTPIDRFLRDFVNDIVEESAAIFAGAGMSSAAGFVNWRALVKPFAEVLSLDINKEDDLIAIAQYYYNKSGSQRHEINQHIIANIATARAPTENHQILARLPLKTYWTTNYDTLIEDSLRDARKISDIKHCVPHLATSKPRRDAVIYKMHGDVGNPHETVLLKDDYERYHIDRGAFITALAGDLVSKTFLFIGFSFTDPNLEYVLSHIRNSFKSNQRRHYCVMRRCARPDFPSDSDFDHAKALEQLKAADLLRFNIATLFVSEYSEITTLLRNLEILFRRRTIFISASAHTFGEWSHEECHKFLHDLSGALVNRGLRVVTGYGLGVGDSIVSGALREVYSKRAGHIEDSLVMRPFPQATANKAERERLWKEYRQDMISIAGIAIVLFGNKLVDDKIVIADGVMKEVEIAKDQGLKLVPVGATGFAAHECWRSLMDNFQEEYVDAPAGLIDRISALGDPVESPSMLISRILDAISLLTKDKDG